MSNRASHTSRPAPFVVLAALLLAALVVLGMHAGAADGKAAHELGKTKRTPKPLCPKNCLVAAKVTAFQVSADGQKGVFKVPSDGRIVAWSVDLGSLDAKGLDGAHEKFKDKKYDGRSVARLAILRSRKKSRFKLTKQTPPVKLEPKFGTRPIFTLGKAIRVKKGVRVALTTPNYIPNFTTGLPNGENQWITSRQPDKCSSRDALEARPHRKLGSTRKYGCRFDGERILYWAYFVPDKAK